MAEYNREKLHKLIMEHRELSASIRTFNHIREGTRANVQLSKALVSECDAKVHQKISSEHLQPLSTMPIDQVLEAYDQQHPTGAYLVRQNAVDFVESVEDDTQIQEQVLDLQRRFDNVARVVTACTEFLKDRGITPPRVTI